MAESQAAAAVRKPLGPSVSETRRVSRRRKKVSGTPQRPRLVVHRSARHIHVQLVNDENGTTVAAASSIEADVRGLDGGKKAHSVRGGRLIAERAKAAGIESVVFDRGGYTYGGGGAEMVACGRKEGRE